MVMVAGLAIVLVTIIVVVLLTGMLLVLEIVTYVLLSEAILASTPRLCTGLPLALHPRPDVRPRTAHRGQVSREPSMA